MVVTKELKKKIETVVSMALEDESLEDFLGRFDVSPEDAFLMLYESGMIDTELFEKFILEE